MSDMPRRAGRGPRRSVRPCLLLAVRVALRRGARQAAATLSRVRHAHARERYEAHEDGAVGFSR